MLHISNSIYAVGNMLKIIACAVNIFILFDSFSRSLSICIFPIFLTAKAHFIYTSKPKGTDDDFKTAACAGSLVKVAQKFVSGSGPQFSKRFTVAKIHDNDDHATPMEPHEDYLLNDPKLKQRRHSRSLPASPLASPKTMRKFQPQPNPYFTITGSDNNAPKQ